MKKKLKFALQKTFLLTHPPAGACMFLRCSCLDLQANWKSFFCVKWKFLPLFPGLSPYVFVCVLCFDLICMDLFSSDRIFSINFNLKKANFIFSGISLASCFYCWSRKVPSWPLCVPYFFSPHHLSLFSYECTQVCVCVCLYKIMAGNSYKITIKVVVAPPWKFFFLSFFLLLPQRHRSFRKSYSSCHDLSFLCSHFSPPREYRVM